MTARPTAAEVLAKVLADEGGEPGSSLHSWRCEYPDVYGGCDCIAETAAEMVRALAAAGLLATSEAETAARAEAWDEGYLAGHECLLPSSEARNWGYHACRMDNPYRADGRPGGEA